MKTLKEVPIGETCIVKKLHGEGAVKRRIMDMGVTKGVEVYVRKEAPLSEKPMRRWLKLNRGNENELQNSVSR